MQSTYFNFFIVELDPKKLKLKIKMRAEKKIYIPRLLLAFLKFLRVDFVLEQLINF